jgi:hypothetical protein
MFDVNADDAKNLNLCSLALYLLQSFGAGYILCLYRVHCMVVLCCKLCTALESRFLYCPAELRHKVCPSDNKFMAFACCADRS